MPSASLPQNTLNPSSYTRGFYTDQMLFHRWGCAIPMSHKLGRVHKTGKSKRSVGSTPRSAQFLQSCVDVVLNGASVSSPNPAGPPGSALERQLTERNGEEALSEYK